MTLWNTTLTHTHRETSARLFWEFVPLLKAAFCLPVEEEVLRRGVAYTATSKISEASFNEQVTSNAFSFLWFQFYISEGKVTRLSLTYPLDFQILMWKFGTGFASDNLASEKKCHNNPCPWKRIVGENKRCNDPWEIWHVATNQVRIFFASHLSKGLPSADFWLRNRWKCCSSLDKSDVNHLQIGMFCEWSAG